MWPTREEFEAQPRYGYMCGVDYQHEVGHAAGGNRIFPTVDDLKKHFPCVDDCGIVKVEVRLVEWVHPQNLRGTK